MSGDIKKAMQGGVGTPLQASSVPPVNPDNPKQDGNYYEIRQMDGTIVRAYAPPDASPSYRHRNFLDIAGMDEIEAMGFRLKLVDVDAGNNFIDAIQSGYVPVTSTHPASRVLAKTMQLPTDSNEPFRIRELRIFAIRKEKAEAYEQELELLNKGVSGSVVERFKQGASSMQGVTDVGLDKKEVGLVSREFTT